MKNIENQTLALAGIFQSARVINQLATEGTLDQTAFDCNFDSLFTFDAPDTMTVFGKLSGLSCGLQVLTQYLGGEDKTPAKNVVYYYVISMMKIASKLKRDQNLAGDIQQKLHQIESRSKDFELSRQSIISQIDGVYQSTISMVKPRIMVQGEQNHLANQDNAGKIRTLLMAGIRAAVLWQQLGGSNWKLLFSRKKYALVAHRLSAGNGKADEDR